MRLILKAGVLVLTVHRWRIADGRSISDVILALKLDGASMPSQTISTPCTDGRRSRPNLTAPHMPWSPQ